MQSFVKTITVGARSSPLSRKQVEEVLLELQHHVPDIKFDVQFTLTTGDRDQKTSLRTLDKTNFFTKEVDELLLNGECRIGIHSAKDLPHPLPKGLALVCLTKGVDSADSLVLCEHVRLETLRLGALIATSSERREHAVTQLRSDLKFCDIRGTIGERLQKLEAGEVDGIVIAEAALIRLGLTHLNRYKLPGSTVEGQGQLAILARDNDDEMRALFACMNWQ